MTQIRTREASRLCTATELELFKQSMRPQITELTVARVKTRITRARKLRDKYRDLADQQRGEARGKREPTGRTPAAGNRRTERKVMIFQQALDRFEDRLATLEARAEREQADGRGDSEGTTATRSTSKAKGGRKKSARSRTSPVRALLDDQAQDRNRSMATRSKKSSLGRRANLRGAAGFPRIKGHVSAQTKRREGKRDSRN